MYSIMANLTLDNVYNVYLLTSCPANSGMYSIMANLTLHLVSSANSTMAGNKLCDSCLIPITCKKWDNNGKLVCE